MSRFSDNLRRLRRERNFSVAQVANFCGATPDEVLDWEDGNSQPSESEMSRLCELFGVDADYFDRKVFNVDFGQNGERKSCSVNFDKNGINFNFNNKNNPEKDKKFSVKKTDDGIKFDFGKKEKNMEEERRRKKGEAFMDFPYWAVCLIAYLLMGFLGDLWHPGWLVFMTIPMYYGLVNAIVNKKANHFPYPVLAVTVYLLLGFLGVTWTWSLFIFATIPLYYILTARNKRIFSTVVWPLICIAVYVAIGCAGFIENWWSFGWVIILTCPIVAFFDRKNNK